MCGIVGLVSRRVGGFWGKDLDIMEQMLIVDQLRGKDSTGTFTVYKNKQSEIIKIASHPAHLFACKAWGEYRQRVIQRGRLIIGHNRAATRGEVKTQNAHPFTEDNIILVHNGTLFDTSNLTKKDVEVDSNAVAHALANGADAAEVLPTIRGAFALVWYDTEKEKLYAVRNDQRPLCLITTSNNYVLSSEPMIAAIALDRNDDKILDMTVMEPGDLYEFGDYGSKPKITKIDLSKKAQSHTTTASQRSGTTSATGTAESIATRTVCTQQEEMDDPIPPFVMGNPPKEQADVPPAIGALRKALAEQAKNKGVLSKDCALTQSKGGNPPVGLTQVETISDMDRTAFNNTRMIHIDHPSLKPHRKVLVKVTEIYRGESGRFRWRGKIASPGEALTDAVGICPETWTEGMLAEKLVGKLCTGFVYFVTHTSGGSSVFVRNIDVPQMTDVHKNRVPFLMWQHALAFCTCIKCGQPAKAWDKNFTQISAKSVILQGGTGTRNVISMMCASCVQQVLKGDELEEFLKRRNAVLESVQKSTGSKAANSNNIGSVQDREPVMPQSGGGTEGKIIVPGSSTLQ